MGSVSVTVPTVLESCKQKQHLRSICCTEKVLYRSGISQLDAQASVNTSSGEEDNEVLIER